MTELRYFFGELVSGEVLAEIPLGSVSTSRKLGDFGELRATFYMDMTGFDNATLKAATQPCFCFCAAEREGVPVWFGMIWSRTYQSQAKVVQIYCKTLEAYPAYRILDTSFSRTSIDQMTIFRDLWNKMQSEAGSNLGIIVPSSFPEQSTVLQSVAVDPSENRTYRDVMDDLANGDAGFDWTIDVAKGPSDTYVKTLRAEQPFLGASSTIDSLTFEYPGNILNYYDTDSASDAGTNIFVLGAGQGTAQLQAVATNQALIDQGFLRIDTAVQTKTTTDQGTLNSIAAQQGKVLKLPINTIKVQLKADQQPVIGSYELGDRCDVVIKDAWNPPPTGTNQAGLKKSTRIIEIDYNPAESDSTEEAMIIFEGPQEAT